MRGEIAHKDDGQHNTIFLLLLIRDTAGQMTKMESKFAYLEMLVNKGVIKIKQNCLFRENIEVGN